MKRIFILASIILFSFSGQAQTFKVIHQEETRKYILHLPSGYDPAKMYPLVFNFHGLGSNAKQQQRFSDMNALADREQFIVVYPQGIGHKWNTGIGQESYRYGRDDVGFVSRLLDSLIAGYNIDTMRVYSTGLSLGGYFSYRLACELDMRFAAMASVSGVMTDSTAAYCHANRNVPVLQIHGTTDPIVSYRRTEKFYGVEETVSYWTAHNLCAEAPDTTYLPDTNTRDHCTAMLIRYNSCGANTSVLFYKITDGGHTWPGGSLHLPGLGHRNMDVNASELIWDFFKGYTLDAGTTAESAYIEAGE